VKKLTLFIFSIIVITSCNKYKFPSIVGQWIETSAYVEQSPSQFQWIEAGRWPLNMTFTNEGEFWCFNDVPAGYGEYSFDHSTKQLKMKAAVSGQTNVYTVSLLRVDEMIVDIVINGSIVRKTRYRRLTD
jgi:hypothetical protein